MADKNDLRRELDNLNRKDRWSSEDHDRAREIRWALREQGEQVVAQPYRTFLREGEKLPAVLARIREHFGKKQQNS